MNSRHCEQTGHGHPSTCSEILLLEHLIKLATLKWTEERVLFTQEPDQGERLKILQSLHLMYLSCGVEGADNLRTERY